MNNNNFDEIINGMKEQKSKKDAEDFLMKKLSPEQSRKLNKIMSDRVALEQMLSTPQAQELLKKLTEDKNG